MKKPSTLPHLTSKPFLTDGGLETTLIFHREIDLPHFAAFHLLSSPGGLTELAEYYRTYAKLAVENQTGFVLESPTWRASRDWIEKLGYPESGIRQINREAIGLMVEIREEWECESSPMVISGCVGPRGDGYVPGSQTTAEDFFIYHSEQIHILREAGAEMIGAITMNTPEEALGIARAAAEVDLPAMISFTVETDGKLPTGHALKEAIELVDRLSPRPPAYYMINCAHPTHFESAISGNESWLSRIRGVRANASTRSHAELNESPDLDAGDPEDLGLRHRTLLQAIPHLNVFGGCCGTDHRHVEAICKHCLAT